MSSIQLLEPFFENGIRNTNFFNGRILSAEDLQAEQEANRRQHEQLGRALGEGVAYGLEVSRIPRVDTKTLVTISPGLAVNRNGQTLRLPAPVDLSLVQPSNSAGLSGQTTFRDCLPFQTGSYVAGAGVYLLTIAPAEGREGRALVSGLGRNDVNCNTKYNVEGVQFRLVQLDISAAELSDENRQRLQNLVAYKCFGVAETKSFARDPFGAELSQYGLLDGLRPNRLTDCDVPLAVLLWTVNGGIEFIDTWSVRRRSIGAPADERLDILIGGRRRREAEAILLQFADHLQALISTLIHPESAVAIQHFRYLPPVGLLPLVGPGVGFNYTKFLEGRVYSGPSFIEGSRIEPLVRSALAFAPIDLNSNEMIWLYSVRENRDRTEFEGGVTPFPYVIFASGHIPYFGEARFDVARWDYSNYRSIPAL